MRQFFVASVLLASLWLAQRARAGGLEYTGQGAQSLARGGAVAARADDPMVLAHNPAGLAELRGSQFLLNVNLALFDACVDPAGYYGWGAYDGGIASELYDAQAGENVPLQLGAVDSSGPMPRVVEADYYSDPYDTVCLDQAIVPIPQIAWSRRLTEELGVGFGLIFPAVQPSGRWGGRRGVIRGDDGDLRPAATRYMLLESNNLGIFPNLGVGYRIMKELRLGLAVEWGIVAANNFTMGAALGGTSPSNDIIAHVKAQDWFIPAFTASIHSVPIDALDVVLAFRFQGDVKAEGDLDLTTGAFAPGFRTTTTGHIPVVSLTQRMPWKLRAGVRYADRYAPRPSGTGRAEADPSKAEVLHDPLQDERWDVELDVEYQMNSRNDEQVLTYKVGRSINFIPEDPASMPAPQPFPHPQGPDDTRIEKYWQDQVSVRLGGTLNVVPGRFGVSGGAHYETRGVDPGYMQLDFWPVQRLGLHTGVMVRIAKSIDVVLSYAHIFQETIVVAPPEHRAREEIYAQYVAEDKVVGIDKTTGVPLSRSDPQTVVLEEKSQGTPDATAKLDQNLNRVLTDQPPWIINAGRYRSNFDILAAGVNVHF